MNAKRAPRQIRESGVSYTGPHKGVSEQELRALTRKIVRAVHPEMVVLFGSRAYGKPRSDSDLDLLVVTDTKGTRREQSQQIAKLFPASPIKLDVHTRTPAELTHRLEIGDDFIQEIVGRGKRIYPNRQGNGFVRRVEQALKRGQEQPMDNAEVVEEWVHLAEGDYAGAQFWSRRRKDRRPEKLCWDCEQCAEKYLKAFLTRHRTRFERSHDITTLCELCCQVDSDFKIIQEHVARVEPCKPQVRYPGSPVSEGTSRDAFEAAKTIRKFVRAKMGLR